VSAPYASGSRVAWFELADEGMTVESATVIDVTQVDREHWSVHTDRGEAVVDRSGEGPEIAPLTEDVVRELDIRGERFTVRPTERDLELERDRWDLERGLDDEGYERGF
jgi:hypothetical protein